mmetsp:Transcript_12077/g.18135  ORF Transcript_12077/g.18135 Transcript_12077/m.18135 type:complete len:289 (-) Transcript_12077:390-1256(-)
MILQTKILLISLLSTQCLLQTFAFTVQPSSFLQRTTMPTSTTSTTSTSNGNGNGMPKSHTTTTTALSLADIDMAEVESFRKLFYLWFFGGSGGGGIAIAAFPAMYDRFSAMRSLASSEPTLGGPTINLSPLCLYPQDIALKDFEKIINNKMTVEQMVKKGPQESFWAQRGYLRFEAFEAANKKCNPLALRAIFDALTKSTSIAEPDVAQELLDSFRGSGGVELFKGKLLKSKFSGYGAIGFLLFLLGLAAETSADALAKGWFPQWPGLENFPIGLVDPGVWTIPDYWI